jgi:hypothetical protein
MIKNRAMKKTGSLKSFLKRETFGTADVSGDPPSDWSFVIGVQETNAAEIWKTKDDQL